MKNEIEKKQKYEIKVYNKEEFVARFEPMNMMKEFRSVNTLVKAVDAEVEALSVQKKNFSEDTILAMIELHLVALNQAMNVHEKLSPMQMTEISIEIIENYYFMTMVEIAYVFKRAKSGHYGKISYSLNMPDVLQWFEKYAEERCQHFMQRSDSKGAEAKQNAEASKLLNEATLKVLSAFKETLAEKEEFDEEAYKEFKDNYNDTQV